MEIQFDVIEYMGQVQGGVFVLLSLNFSGKFYEGIFYYKADYVSLTVDSDLENLIGSSIEDWLGYGKLMNDIYKKVLPYSEAKNIVNEFDSSRYNVIFPDK